MLPALSVSRFRECRFRYCVCNRRAALSRVSALDFLHHPGIAVGHDMQRRRKGVGELLARRQGRLVTRAEITEHVWDWAWEGTSNVIDVHVSALRAVLREHPDAPTIETIRGAGFILHGEGDAEPESPG